MILKGRGSRREGDAKAFPAAVALPRKQLLVDQIVGLLKDQIRSQTWPEWLPRERDLSRHLQVSRNTLRGALRQLKEEGWIESVHARGNRIRRPHVGGEGNRGGVQRSVGILLPHESWRLTPHNMLVIEEITRLLSEAGMRVEIHHGGQYYASRKSGALERLLRRHRHDGWIVWRSDKRVQRWFWSKRIPCVVSGGPADDSKLPSVSYDTQAVCRHAVGVLYRLGHRHIGLLLDRTRYGSRNDATSGFREGIADFVSSGLKGSVIDCGASVASFCSALGEAMREPGFATGLIAVDTAHYLSACGVLQQRRLCVPGDVSVLPCGDDPIFANLVPKPDCYRFDAFLQSRKIVALIRRGVEGEIVAGEEHRLLPEYIRGQSTGPPPG